MSDSTPHGRLAVSIAGGIVVGGLLLLMSARLGTFLGRLFVESQAHPETDASLAQRYDGWKLAHSQPVETLMQYYAPDVRILRLANSPETYNDLVKIAQLVRKQRTFDSVTEVEPPLITVSGNSAEVLAKHTYGHSSRSYPTYIGKRRLSWEKRNGQWLIVEDRFPTNYIAQGQPKTTRSIVIIPRSIPPPTRQRKMTYYGK